MFLKTAFVLKKDLFVSRPVENLGDTCDVLRDLVPFVNLKDVKNIHAGGVLLLVKLQAFSLQFY